MVIRRSISRHVARYDLGCGVWRCHDRHHVAVLKKSAIFVHEPRSTEVRNDTVSFRVHQDVLRLYVMVNDAALVKIVQSEDLPRGKTHKKATVMSENRKTYHFRTNDHDVDKREITIILG